jgi:hypothetical protein
MKYVSFLETSDESCVKWDVAMEGQRPMQRKKGQIMACILIN